MRELKQSTAANVMVFMTSSSDHVSGAPGLTLTTTVSKNGAAFATITPTVTDRGSGWYNLAFTTSHTDTLGDLAVHITAAGADPSDFRLVVVANLEADTYAVVSDGTSGNAALNTDLDTLLARLTSARAGYLDNVNNSTLPAAVFPTDPADQSLLIAATDAISAAIASLNNLSQANVRTALGLGLANLDTQLSGINAKTTNLPADPTGQTALLAALVSAHGAGSWATATGFAVAGSAMTLTSGERNSIAAALLDLADGVEAGKTVRQALRLIAAALAGKRSNSGTANEQFDAIGSPGTARIVGNLDSAGDGTPVLTP